MKTNKLNVFFIIFLFSGIPNMLVAQDWYKAKIDTPPTDGYYYIELANEVLALSHRKDLLDIRIIDTLGKEMPFFVKQQMQQNSESFLQPFKLLGNETIQGDNQLIIHNIDKKTINHLLVASKAADTNCSIDVRGSNNYKDWFVVKQKSAISTSLKRDKNVYFDVKIPEGDYEYYELNISNSQKLPLDIQGAYWMFQKNTIPALSAVNTGDFNVVDSAKQTIINFPNIPYNYKIMAVKVYTNNKQNYQRSAKLQYAKDEWIPFQLISVTGGNEVKFNRELSMGKDFKIIIENGDNPPLEIDSIQCFSKKMLGCAYLTQNTPYELTIGYKEEIPNYDIANFANDISDNLAILQQGRIEKIVRPIVSSPIRETMWIEKPFVMWSIIIVVGMILLFICAKMIIEMKK